MENSSKGEFRGFKKMKIWKDKKTGHKSMMIFPASFGNVNGGYPYWIWDCYEETSDDNTLVAKLVKVCWLEVKAHINMSELSAELSTGIDYEIAYKVKLTTQATGWELPITLDVRLPNDTKVRRRQYSLFEKPREEWMYLVGGIFQIKKGETGEARFDLVGRGGWWKTGLIIQGIIIRPKP